MARTGKRLILTMVLLLLFSNVGLAASISGMKTWQVPIVGVFRAPQEFMASEFAELKKAIDSQKDKLDTQSVPIPEAKERLDPNRVDYTAYQMTMNDRQAYHLAWLLVMRDRMPLDPQTIIYFEKPLTIEQRAAVIMAEDTLRQTLDKMQYTDPQSGAGIRLLELDSFEFGQIGGKRGYAAGARFLINYKDFVFPIYTKCWLFNAGGYGAAALLITTDSERAFWTPVMNSVLATYQTLDSLKKK